MIRVSVGTKCWFFGKFCLCTKWMTPLCKFKCHWHACSLWFFIIRFLDKIMMVTKNLHCTKKMKFIIKDFFSKCDPFRRRNCGFGHIYWRNRKWKTLFFCVVEYVKIPRKRFKNLLQWLSKLNLHQYESIGDAIVDWLG